MKKATKILVMAILALASVMATDDVRAQANKTDCGRVRKLLDQYAHTLFLNSIGTNAQPLEVGTKDLLDEFQQLNVPEETMIKIQSLLQSIRQCYAFAGSAQYGMKGFLTDLRFRLKQDADLREKCSHVEDQYNKWLQECGAEAVK
jgi:hypothetical protein